MADDAGREPGGAVLRGASASTYAGLARNRGFRNLAASTLVSTTGDWLGFLAIIALVSVELGPTRWAAFAVSAVMAARVLPSLLLGPVAGMLVDRWDRKRVMISAHIGRGIVMALIPFADVLAILLATLVIETMSAMFTPAKDAVFPTLVKTHELVVANQVNLVSTYGTLPLGGGLYAVIVGVTQSMATGGLIADRPMSVPIWVNAASYVVAAAFVWRIPMSRGAARQPVAREERDGPWEEFKEGLRFVGGHPVIRTLILGVMVAAAVAGVVITAGEFFGRLLNAGPSGYGILVAVVGSGLVIGLVVAAPLAERISTERLFGPGIGIAGVGLIVTSTMPSMGAAVAPAVVMGAGAGVAFIVGYTVLQRRADDRIRGRTFGAFNSGVRAAIFGSTIFSPVLIGVLGRERRVLTQLPDGTTDFLFPYTFGGVRITLLVAGILAVVGAVLTGTGLHSALRNEERRAGDLELPTSTPVSAPTSHGALVVFEGGDGSGKSTQIRLLRAAIERTGRDVIVTREPGGTSLGEGIREVLLSRASDAMSDRTEALLYAAARAQHVEEVIRPALEKGAVVLCDRFVDSSIVYQGIARGLGEDQVIELNRWATGGLLPELTVLLDVDPVEGLRRATEGRDADRLEAAGLHFHRTVRNAYRQRALADPDRYLVLDATRSVEELHEEIRTAVLDRIGGGRGADGASGASRRPAANARRGRQGLPPDIPAPPGAQGARSARGSLGSQGSASDRDAGGRG